uniref:Uncharacterized protein n=1 Tax=Panagrellus redivivus TaxID=6233 RepID=A0A7E4W664_PANRE
MLFVPLLTRDLGNHDPKKKTTKHQGPASSSSRTTSGTSIKVTQVIVVFARQQSKGSDRWIGHFNRQSVVFTPSKGCAASVIEKLPEWPEQ